MKRLILLVVMLLVVVLAQPAYALPTEHWFKITDSSKNEIGVFSATQLPWLYVKLKDKDESIAGWWKPITGSEEDIQSDVIENGYIFRPLSEFLWQAPTAPGTFDYLVHVNGYGNDAGKGFSFQGAVAPEPISSALFLLGGGALIMGRLRKKK